MRTTGAVQVVLGEGEPGILRFVLEAEGFQVVGQARGEAELRRVLDVTHPSVIVLDAGISATAARDARDRAAGAQLVVVWPSGVRSSVVDERVDAATVLQDLGAAVRRAAERATASWDDAVVALPESSPVDPDPRALTLVADDARAAAARKGRRGSRHLLVVVAAWALALTASAAAALVVPSTLDRLERPGMPEAPTTLVPPAVGDRSEPTPDAPSDTPGGGACERPDRDGEPRSDHGPGERGRGCGSMRGQGRGPSDGAKGAGNANGRGEGGPSGERSEPGTNGEANGNEGPGGNGGGGGGTQGNGGGDDAEGETGSDVTDGTDDGGGGKGKASGRTTGRSSGSKGSGKGRG